MVEDRVGNDRKGFLNVSNKTGRKGMLSSRMKSGCSTLNTRTLVQVSIGNNGRAFCLRRSVGGMGRRVVGRRVGGRVGVTVDSVRRSDR